MPLEDLLDLLNLEDRKRSACVRNLPSHFTKDDLKNYLEQKGFRCKHIVVLDENGKEAMVVMTGTADFERLMSEEHDVEGISLIVTPGNRPLNGVTEIPVFTSVDAQVNPVWMHNDGMKQALDRMQNGVQIKRQKDGVHLVASLQKIVQAEKQLKMVLTAKSKKNAEYQIGENVMGIGTTAVRPKESKSASAGSKEGSSEKGSRAQRMEELYKGESVLHWEAVDTKSNAENSTNVPLCNSWEGATRAENPKLVLDASALPQREPRKPRSKREIYQMGDPRRNRELMDMTDEDLQLINEIMDKDLNSSSNKAKPCEKGFSPVICGNTTAPSKTSTASKSFEKSTAAEAFDTVTEVRPVEKATTVEPIKKITVAQAVENSTAAQPKETPAADKPKETSTAYKTPDQITAAKTVAEPTATAMEEIESFTGTNSDEELDTSNPFKDHLRLCQFCFKDEGLMFTCSCGFDVCHKCRENNECPKCGKDFHNRNPDGHLEENLADSQHATLFSMRHSKLKIPGSGGTLAMRMRVVPKDSPDKENEKNFWLPDSKEGRECHEKYKEYKRLQNKAKHQTKKAIRTHEQKIALTEKKIQKPSGEAEAEVEKKLKKLKPGKSPGPDYMHPRILKKTASQISKPAAYAV
ncbi:hypothetical protein CAPTEDRAFT_199844 [Capitella teleta]|uniref:Uncharacterized protein n=1 Tax=Capitella teleta TaxID=283909 RepID=R7VBW3_CAPTE|nr:hypothetical protein CAPTEDRAFT_199844 [Capitella teleta]|eukprot:ELU16052.1 hypothetical protein CAPTEDRAFT_199844 [Capitella teleta]